MQYCEFEGPAIAMAGNWMTKIAPEKIENKFSKMLDKDAISQIRGSCDCDGRKLDDENRGWKNWKQILKNLGRRHNIANSTVLRLGWKKLGDENHGQKNRTDVFDFLAAIFVTQFPPSQSQDPWIRDIVSSSNIFENFFQFFRSKLWWGKWGDEKHRQKKSKKSVRFFRSQFPSPNHTNSPPHRTSPLQSSQDPRWVTKIEQKESKISATGFFLAAIFIAPLSQSQCWIFIKPFWKLTHRNIKCEGPAVTMRGGGSKNCSQKIRFIIRIRVFSVSSQHFPDISVKFPEKLQIPRYFLENYSQFF